MKVSSLLFAAVVWIYFLIGCGELKTSVQSLNTNSNIPSCIDDALNSDSCSTSAARYVTATAGGNISSWTNSSATNTVTANINTGFYNGNICSFTDTNLSPGNIVSGVSIFGVSGTASGPYSSCTDNAVNAPQCSTSANRYVYTTENGGRSANCSTGANAIACWTNNTNQYVTGTAGANISGTDGSLTTAITAGYYSGSQTVTMSDTDLSAANIANGINIFGTTGSFTGTFKLNMASTAHRNAGVLVLPNWTDITTTSNQITLQNESVTYAGSDMPTTGGFGYRDIPDMRSDDDGFWGGSCKYAPRPTSNCGTSQTTIALRIADCATANPSSHTWNGATQCNGGQGTWRLVTRSASNKEVWQDQRTGLLWSSVVGTGLNWCQATGNTQANPLTLRMSLNNTSGTAMIGNGTISGFSTGSSTNSETIIITFSNATTFSVVGTAGAAGCQGGTTSGSLTTTAGSMQTYSDVNECSFTITQGSVNFSNNDIFIIQATSNSNYGCTAGGNLQPASPLSYCAEAVGLNSDASENWSAGTYFSAKGGMGKNSTPSVRWRVPTINDYKMADVNGISFVMPDMGTAGTSRPNTFDSSAGAGNYEWSTTVNSDAREFAKTYSPSGGGIGADYRDSLLSVRCVGR